MVQASLYDRLSELRGVASAPRANATSAERPSVAPLTDEEVFENARRHLRSNFPSFWGPIARAPSKPRSKFGTFFRELNVYHYTASHNAIAVYDDKLTFDGLSQKLGLGGPRCHWLVSRRTARRLSDHRVYDLSEALDIIAGETFFAKARRGGGGGGAFKLTPQTITHADGRIEATAPDALRRLFDASDEDYLLQDIIPQAERLSTLNPTSINTLRILSYLDRRGAAHIVGCTIRMGAGGMVVDNTSSGGMCCGVDIHTKRILGPAHNDPGEVFERHPATGVTFEGYAIPELDDAFGAAARAHEAIGYPTTVGWDVVLAPDGPILLEGNPRWSQVFYRVIDPMVAVRTWALYLDDWRDLDLGFDRTPLTRSPAIRDKKMTVVVAVSGAVQDAGYGRWAAKIARRRALSGAAENCADGAVRVTLRGPARRVEFALMQFATGPSGAKVADIKVERCSVD